MEKHKLQIASQEPSPTHLPTHLPTYPPTYPWVKLAVLFHVICITAWSCPVPSAQILQGRAKPEGADRLLFLDDKYLRGDARLAADRTVGGPVPAWWTQCVTDPIQAYLGCTGTWQYWDMFAPNPMDVDFWGDAKLYYKSGRVSVYQYPRMFLLPIPEKYVEERFRKFFERAHDDSYQWLFARFGLRIALLNDKDPLDPPVRVVLNRHWLGVMPPGVAQPTGYSSYSYFTYEVDQRLLRKLETQGP
jgi:hypothetical protein